ncbi:thioredoxin family protein [Luteimonas pelagia]
MNDAGYRPEPTREALDALPGDVLLEFGTDWCGHCIAARPLVESALSRHPGVRHVKVEDGRGRPLGRAFRVKLWPTLVRVRQGEELARAVRPGSAEEIERLFAEPPTA